MIVTPALADANNGNWQTARRWRAMLGARHEVTLAAEWKEAGGGQPSRGRRAEDPGAGASALMIALHARRSAASIAAWRQAHPDGPLVVALTGTDLYRDIETDAAAQHSLQLADRLIVLNERGPDRLPATLRDKCRVVLQSCSARQPRRLPLASRHLRVLMVGHLRAEKDPQTFFRAVERLRHRPDILLDHVGRALDPALGEQAAALAAARSQYRWLGGLPHEAARRRIQAAHLLVHPSRMEGGAHVVIEAIRSGTPVLASRIDGNVGLLGPGYGGYFEPGDDEALARLIERARDDADILPFWRQQVGLRAALFEPQAEAAALHRVVEELLV